MTRIKFTKTMLAIIISIVLIVSSPMKARAAIPELFAAVPVTWPVVVAVLIGAGVGTAIYYNTLPEEERASLLDDIQQALIGKGLTLAQQAAVAGAIAINTIGSYIRAAIVDGKSYISKDVTDTILDTAKAQGLTGGEVSRVTAVQTMTLDSTRVVGVDFYTIDRLMFPTSWESSVTINWGTQAQFAKATEIVNKLPSGSFWGVASVTNDIVCYYSILNGLSGEYKAKSFTRYGRLEMYGAVVDGSVTSRYIRINRDGNVVEEFDISGTTVWYNVAGVNGSGYEGKGNVGKYTVASTGAPVGELGQAVEQDGAWSYPVPQVDIDNYGAGIGVSTAEDVIGIDGVTRAWETSVAYPDIALPDVAGDTAIDIPTSLTQVRAAEAEAEESKPIADDSAIVPDIGSFLVPDWIKRRFPFCIPFDILDIINSFGEGDAPVIDYTITFDGGYDCRLYVDFADYDEYVTLVRFGLYVGFVAALIYGTRNLISW